MTSLLARLEKATGPDKELFEACYTAMFGAPQAQSSAEDWDKWYRFNRLLDAKAWTDAALMLVEGNWQIGMTPGPWATVGANPPHTGATPALALCIAMVKARAACP